MMLQASHIHRLFLGSLALKGFNAAVEAIGGLLLFFVPGRQFVHLVAWLTQAELHHDPDDHVALTLMKWASEMSVTRHEFFALYLIGHGVIKLAIVTGLFWEAMWMFPVGLATLGAFVTYQLYRVYTHHSVGLLVITIFDILIMWFIWREWGVKRAEHAKNHPAPMQHGT